VAREGGAPRGAELGSPAAGHRVRARFLRPLDRYVASEFTKIFFATAFGFPLLVIVIDLTDRLGKYLNRHLTPEQIALAYVYYFPESMYMVLPAAVLFATVFTIGSLTRHSELTAAKASGISFYRLLMPIFAGAAIVMVMGFALGELVPITDIKRNDLLEEGRYKPGNERYNFAYAAPKGRVYKVAALNVERRLIDNLEVERRGRGPDYPTYLLAARTATFDTTHKMWTLHAGELHVLPDSMRNQAVSFDSVRDADFSEAPVDLTSAPKSPEQMGFKELRRFITSLERSGADANEIKVELSLKIAIPVACVIIVFFGAPLATSTQRGGAAFGIGISLATTIIYLMLIQLTKAIGEGGAIPPYLAAWIPNMIFGAIGVVLLARVRT
jgi:lipopolysaccharide export system permease protein